MKIDHQIDTMSQILAPLVLLLFSGLSFTANAVDYMPENDLTAPCGELHLIGRRSYIFNQSDFTLNVIFKTNADTVGLHSLNAGAVKYLERDDNGAGVWRDTGVGDYRSSKTYTVPVKSKDVVTIVYCASKSADLAKITGTVSFKGDASEPLREVPADNVAFKGLSGYTGDEFGGYYQTTEVTFKNADNESVVRYNAIPSGITSNGTMTICPADTTLCALPD